MNEYIDIETLKLIQQELNKLITETVQHEDALKIRNILKDNLCLMGRKLGYLTYRDFRVARGNDRDNKTGIIDVMWKKNNNIILIHVDSTPGEKSAYKLTNNTANQKIWVYCDTIKFRDFMAKNKHELRDIIKIPVFPYKSISKETRASDNKTKIEQAEKLTPDRINTNVYTKNRYKRETINIVKPSKPSGTTSISLIPLKVLEDMRDEINKLINEAIPLEDVIGIEKIIIDYVYTFGQRLGYDVQRNFKVGKENKSDAHAGLIAILWEKSNSRVIIEVDSHVRERSAQKLAYTKANQRIWIHCDNMRFRKFLKKNEVGLGGIIELPIISYIEIIRQMRRRFTSQWDEQYYV